MQKVMNNISVIPIDELDDKGWRDYYELTGEIDRKYSPDDVSRDGSWQDFKTRVLKASETYKDRAHREFMITLNEKPEAWLAIRRENNGCFFVFNSLHEEIPGDITRAVLSEVYDYKCSENINSSCYWSFNARCISALRKTGSEPVEELNITRLDRDKMDTPFYQKVVKSTDISGYNLKLFTAFPEDVVEDFTALMNDIFKGIDSLNPYGTVIGERTGDFWPKKYANEKARGSEMKMFMLFDSQNKIAAYCSLFVDPDKPQRVRHGGGFTVVSSNHRGKGFARFLKAKMYLKLLEENKNFKYVTTDTMPWNKYMYRINEEFGFVPYEHGAEFIFIKEFLKNYLDDQGK